MPSLEILVLKRLDTWENTVSSHTVAFSYVTALDDEAVDDTVDFAT